MNKIVRDHYPVANLPQDLREGLENDATVRVVIEKEDGRDRILDRSPGLPDTPMTDRKPLSAKEMVEMVRRYRADNPQRVTSEEAVARIRELRDEWDD